MQERADLNRWTRPLRGRRGASTEEMLVLVACAVGVAVVMGGFFRDAMRGSVRWAEILFNTLVGF